MRLVPTLWLGPRRLVRRPIESTLLFLAVALGTLGTVTAVDATLNLIASSTEGASRPGLRQVTVYANSDSPRDAVYPKDLWNRAMERYRQFPQDHRWLERALAQLPPVETAYVEYASWAQIRGDGSRPWVSAKSSVCADPRIFALGGVGLAAGRVFTPEEWTTGRPVVVVGRTLAQTLFPGLPADQVVGQSVDLSPVSGFGGDFRVTVVGVCQGDESPHGRVDDWLVLTKLPPIDAKYGNGLQFVFQAPTLDEVPGLLASLRALTDREPSLKGQTLESPYEAFRQNQMVQVGLGLLLLAVGGGTLLIALWTLGSVFRSRLPSLARSLDLLRALGASRGTLVFLGLSEILPVALGGLVVGFAGALGLRLALRPDTLWMAHDPWLIGALVILALGLQVGQVGPQLASQTKTTVRPQGQTLRLGFTVAFLAVGLGVSALALSLQHDLGEFFRVMDQSPPRWVGQVQGSDAWFLSVYRGDVDQADLDAVGRVVPPELWTPYFSCRDSGWDRDLDVLDPSVNGRQSVRHKVFAEPLVLSLFHLPLVTGHLPTDAETQTKRYALVSEEVAVTLFKSPTAALGKVLRPVQGNFRGLSEDFEVCGVYQSPNTLQVRYGAPDVLFVPDAALARRMVSSESAKVYGTRLAFDPSVDPGVLADQVVPLLEKAHPHLAVDRFATWSGGANAPDLEDVVRSIHREADQVFVAMTLLTVLFLVVSCLSVLSFMFVDVTSRSREIAIERALGRPFVHFQARAFVQGSVLVLAASTIALGVDAALLPGLTALMRDSLGPLLSDSRGQMSLDPATVALLVFGAAVLAGAVAVLPLVTYRGIPIATLMKDDS